MKKINSFIEKNIILILTIFIIANPLLDVLTSVCINYLHWNFTIGMIVRFIFMAFAIYYILFVKSKNQKDKKFIFVFLILLSILFGLFLINNFSKDVTLGFMELKNLLKVLYYFIMFIFFYSIKDKLKKFDLKYLDIAFIIYISFIFIPNLFGGLDSYDYAKLGEKGLFNSANEISAIISLLFPLFLYSALKSNKKIGYLLVSIIYIYITVSIGTKVPLFALMITLLIFIISLYYKAFKSKNNKLIVISCGSIILMGALFVLLVPKTTFYKNIKIHMDHFEIKSIGDIFSSKDNINNIVFSERLSLIESNFETYKSAKSIDKMFGLGFYYLDNNNVRERKIIEIDYLDIFVCYGIGISILFFATIFISVNNLIKNKNNLGNQFLMYITQYLLIIFIAFFSGHIFTSPSVSMYVALFLTIPKAIEERNKMTKKKILFCANTLCLGGIENALVNLTNKIDYDKYDVTLVLEHKTGEFLNRINKNIRIIDYNLSTSRIKNMYKRIIWLINNYKKYDFSCCYATYSKMAGKLTLSSSANNSIVVHTDNTMIYNKEEFINFYETRDIEKYKSIIFVANEMKNNFLIHFPSLSSKSYVINNIINNKEIMEKSKEKSDFKFKKGEIYFYFVGRLEECTKRLSLMLNAFNKVISKNKKINLLIVGKGPDEEQYKEYVLKNKLEKNIYFLGYQSNPYKFMKSCDYLIMTSIIEGFPVTILESLILNKGVISTLNFSDNNLNIKDYGYIVSSDVNEITKAINKIIKSVHKKNNLNFDDINDKNYLEFKKIMDGDKGEI